MKDYDLFHVDQLLNIFFTNSQIVVNTIIFFTLNIKDKSKGRRENDSLHVWYSNKLISRPQE